ncbi:endonuclease III [Bdellovibrionota bacterium FG-1]
MAKKPTVKDRARAAEVLRILDLAYPESECSLSYKNPFQLLVATILSAQCTDERVNRVTPPLFKRYPGPREMASAPLSEIEELIKSTGFFRNKARSIQHASSEIVAKHGGKVPQTLEGLTALRGVGRKTANVVLGVAYGVPGLVVDTHVGRVSRRLGFTKETDPVKVEHELMELIPQQTWTHYGHLLISHGRAICTARQAKCEECPVARLCMKVL